jgi:acyl-coenzyme A synthetase/AMP-(fatty) acid ligase
MSAIPLVLREGSEDFARCNGTTVTIAQFCADVRAVAEDLPDGQNLINLCQSRYLFTVTFFAALARSQTTLLPARRDASSARALADNFARCRVVSDQQDHAPDRLIDFSPGIQGSAPSPACAGEHIAAIAFTSGSTGQPQPHPKSWQMLDAWRRVHQQQLPLAEQRLRGLVATVPSWHMYGLEWAMLLPTIAPLAIHCGADFYPRDVANALAAFASGAVLVSTPVHLRAMRNLTEVADSLDLILSATAPLDITLAEELEANFAARVFEIYGCSEVGSLAGRYTSAGEGWQFFECFGLHFNDGEITIDHELLPQPVVLADRFKALDSDRYALEGRSSDIVKIGGKRESLGNLNSVLMRLPGVTDGVVYDPKAFGLPDTDRLGALVVAPGRSVNELRKALSAEVDAVFMPRPIRLVERLPRDSTSKLKHAELAKLIAGLEAPG